MRQAGFQAKLAEMHQSEQVYLATAMSKWQGSEPALWLWVLTNFPGLSEATVSLAQNCQPGLDKWQNWFQAKKSFVEEIHSQPECLFKFACS